MEAMLKHLAKQSSQDEEVFVEVEDDKFKILIETLNKDMIRQNSSFHLLKDYMSTSCLSRSLHEENTCIESVNESSNLENPCGFDKWRTLPKETLHMIFSNLNPTELCIATSVWGLSFEDEQTLWFTLGRQHWPNAQHFKTLPITDGKPDIDWTTCYRKLYLELDEGSVTFNSNPFKGMENFINQNLVNNNASDIASFINTTNRLSRAKVNLYLFTKRNDATESRFIEAVTSDLMSFQDYTGMKLPSALRACFTLFGVDSSTLGGSYDMTNTVMLGNNIREQQSSPFSLPWMRRRGNSTRRRNEQQSSISHPPVHSIPTSASGERRAHIRFLLRAFSSRYAHCNTHLFPADTIYMICFSLILLSVDLNHSSSPIGSSMNGIGSGSPNCCNANRSRIRLGAVSGSKQHHNKMSKREFVRNTRNAIQMQHQPPPQQNEPHREPAVLGHHDAVINEEHQAHPPAPPLPSTSQMTEVLGEMYDNVFMKGALVPDPVCSIHSSASLNLKNGANNGLGKHTPDVYEQSTFGDGVALHHPHVQYQQNQTSSFLSGILGNGVRDDRGKRFVPGFLAIFL